MSLAESRNVANRKEFKASKEKHIQKCHRQKQPTENDYTWCRLHPNLPVMK